MQNRTQFSSNERMRQDNRNDKPAKKNVEPESTRLARQTRESANSLSEAQRANLFDQAMQVIYGGPAPRQKTGSR
jgi:hypothetical protein